MNDYRYFQEYTMDVIARVALGQKEIKQFNNPYTELIKSVCEQIMHHHAKKRI